MSYQSLFKMPTPVKITGRTSSITNAFINGIIPCIVPSDEEIKNVLSILGMDGTSISCAYCGSKYTEWDHFRPLIINKRATGYISEINNLVPSCGKCNQSKGNTHWKTWMTGKAQLSPAARKIKDLNERIKRLEEYEEWSNPQKIDFEQIVGKEKWEQHWINCELLHEQMRESQKLSDEIKHAVQEYSTRKNMLLKDKNVTYLNHESQPTDIYPMGSTARATCGESINKCIVTDKELDKNPELYDPLRDGRLQTLLSNKGHDVVKQNNLTDIPANTDDVWNIVKQIRTKKNQSWAQLREGCNAILTGSNNCRPGAKSFANVVIRDTGLSESDIVEILDNKGL
jgi:hypothetical protein